MKETGELLKNRRLEKKFSLEEISSQTKIQLSILKSLEEGRAELMKNKTYTKGFLRQYARALQLNPDDVVAVFDRETMTAAPVASPAMPKLKAEEPIEEKTNVLWFRAPSKMITVGGILVIGTLATAIYFFSVKMASYSEETFKEPETTTEETAQDPALEQPAVTAEPAKVVEEKPVKPAEPSPAPKVVETKAAEPVKEPAKPVEKPAEVAKTPDASKPADVAPPPAKLNKEIAIVATENITVSASWANGQKESVELKANNKHTFYYPKKIVITLSNGSGASVTANGERVQVPGEAGKPATLTFE